MSMTHYFNPMSRAVTTHWMLTELDVKHEQIVVDFMSGETSTPEFRAINPMGKIPVLVDDDIIITEVAAICAYLADKFPEKVWHLRLIQVRGENITDTCSFPGQPWNQCLLLTC